MTDVTRVDAALEGLRQGLETDGYGLRTSWVEDELHVELVALPAACADCLVPKDVMRAIVAQMLEDGGVAVPADRVVLAYPNDRSASGP